MIKNLKQYKISKKHLTEFEKILVEKTPKVSNAKEQGALISVIRLKDQLKEEIEQFERQN